jgi:endonuclease/exonuclease/phosphatase (EEP) superfamily protein YafD
MEPEPSAPPDPALGPAPSGPSRNDTKGMRWLLRSACFFAALVHPIAGLLSRWTWFADLISHFQVAALFATLLACGLWARRVTKVAAFLAVLAVVQLWPLVRYSGPNPVPADKASAARLRVLMANVYYPSHSYDDLIGLIRSERPDVIGLVEYSSFCRTSLEPLRDEYPYRMEYEAGPSGIALWFRKAPISVDPPTRLVPGRNPVIHGVMEFAGRQTHIWVVHPMSPLSAARWSQAGNPELDEIARRVRSVGGSRIVVGDMNCTDGSSHFSEFVRASGLRDSRYGFGRQASWPTDFFYKIPIDHAFVSDDLAVVDRRLGPTLVSDHSPLIVEFAPADPSAASASSHAPASASAR